MEKIDQLLAIVRENRNTAGATGPSPSEFRIILETIGSADIVQLRASVSSILGLDFQLEPLFPESPDDGALQPFLLLRIPGVAAGDLRGTPYDLAYELSTNLNLRSAEPDIEPGFYVQPTGDPSTPLPEADAAFWCWADEAPPVDHQWAIKAVRADKALAFSSAQNQGAGGRGILIAQPDTGISRHVELDSSALNIELGWDFVDDKPDPIDPLRDALGPDNPGHGTGTASVIISRAGGHILGSAPEATLVPIRALRSVVILDGSRVARAIDHARKKKCHIITMSLGGIFSRAVHAAIRRAVADNMIVLAAAGNCVGSVVWPARLNDCIAVAGCNVQDKPWKGSSRGSDVDITAPGELVWRADADIDGGATDRVSGGQGTSFAVALAAGVAALWLAQHGYDALIASLRANETLQDRFRAMIKQTARRREDGSWFEGMGAGIIDAEKLVKSDPMPPPADAVAAATQSADDISLNSLIDEVAGSVVMEPPAAGAQAEPAPGPTVADIEKYGAELSFLALSTQWRRQLAARAPASDSAASQASAVARTTVSDTLRRAVEDAGDVRLKALIQ